MKSWILYSLLLLSITCNGQGAGMQAMIKQIALVQLYIGYIQKGYSIARQGLTTISDIRNGNWQLDIGFFDRLTTINPAIARSDKVADMLRLEKLIRQKCRALQALPFENAEAVYTRQVTDHLLQELATDIDQLHALLRGKTLAMDDAARLQWVEQLHGEITNQYRFIGAFLDEARLLLLQRTKERTAIHRLRTLTTEKK